MAEKSDYSLRLLFRLYRSEDISLWLFEHFDDEEIRIKRLDMFIKDYPPGISKDYNKDIENRRKFSSPALLAGWVGDFDERMLKSVKGYLSSLPFFNCSYGFTKGEAGGAVYCTAYNYEPSGLSDVIVTMKVNPQITSIPYDDVPELK